MKNIKLKLLKNFEGLHFEEKEHKYFFKDTSINISVSGIIKKYVEPFDSNKISFNIAKKYIKNNKSSKSIKLKQKEILKEWENKKNKACDIGNDTHIFGELYPFNKEKLIPKNKLEEAVVLFYNDLPSNIIPLITELRMFHKKYMFAGTADIIFYNKHTNNFIIGDYKTNKDLFKNYKGKKMLKSFNNLLDCPFNKYQLQLSFYQILFEQTEFKVSSRKLIWLLPNGKYKLYDTFDYTNILKKELKILKI